MSRNPAIAALNACKAVFDAAGPELDRMEGRALAKAVIEEDDYFSDWRGASDQGQPHELSSGELSRLLGRLSVRSRSMRLPSGKWGRGYLRTQIESAWRTHCSENNTATHPRKIIALAKS